MNPLTFEERILALLNNVAEFQRDCKACGAPLWFVKHKNGKMAPYTAAGISHFADCPKAAQFKKAREA